MRSYRKLTLLLIFALALTLLMAVCLIACNSTALSNLTSQKATTFVCIDINPSIELVLDQDDTVMSVGGANNDAKVLLFQEDGIVGAHVNVAIENIASLAVEYKYISDDNHTIDISVVSADDSRQSQIFQSVTSHFEKGATTTDNTLSLQFENALNLALSQELQKIKEQFPSQEEVQTLSVADFRLIKRAIEADYSLSVTDAVLTKKENLIAKVQKMQSATESKYDVEYSEQIRGARLVYENAINAIDGGLYIAHFAKKTLDLANATSMFENLAKTKSALAYTTANAYLTALELYRAGYAQYYQNPDYSVSLLGAKSIADSLDVDVDWLIDSLDATTDKGFVRFEQRSFNDFMNKLYRNASQEERVNIESAFEKAVNNKFTVVTVSDENVGFSIKDVENTINAIKDDFMKELTAGIGDVVEDIVNSVISDCTPSVDYSSATSIDNAISILSKIAQSALDNMALSDEDLSDIEDAKSAIQSTIENALQTYNTAKDTAQQNAISRLSEQKETRKSMLANL